MAKITSYYETDERYNSLRIVAGLLTLIGSVLLAVGAAGLALGLYLLLAGTPGEPRFEVRPFTVDRPTNLTFSAGLSGLFFVFLSVESLLFGLQCIATAALIRLFIHLEENTRVSALALEKIRRQFEPKPEGTETLFLS